MSQNHTLWNLDFRFSLGTLFQESIIQLFVMDYEHKRDRHFLAQKYECTGMYVSINNIIKKESYVCALPLQVPRTEYNKSQLLYFHHDGTDKMR